MVQESVAADAAEGELHWSSTRRLVVVSNRVATGASPSTGGLAVALSEALTICDGLWFGWSGKTSSEAESRAPSQRRCDGYTAVTVDLALKEKNEYYLGFSNECLWPLFHYRLDLAKPDRQQLATYLAVNERLARSLVPTLEKTDVIWVHDYHLIPFAAALRRANVRNKIGFFLHIPFPPPEIFAAVPDHKKLARSLFAYDLVGFQTNRDRDNFIRYAIEALGARQIGPRVLRGGGRTLTVDAFPIGIDVAQFASAARRHANHPNLVALAEQSPCKWIVGVDRLDYSKGLPERLAAIDALLEAWPEHRGAIEYLQIATPTREGITAYENIDAELDRAMGHVNGRHGTISWTPVRYIKRQTPRSFLAGLLRRSHVGLITPLRDGMNLVAKEYVAAQDPLDPGVLILSEFAGAAEQLRDALLVNPYDIESVASAIHTALEMPKSERQARHAVLLDKIRTEDIDWWRQRYVDALLGHPPTGVERAEPPSHSARPSGLDHVLRA